MAVFLVLWAINMGLVLFVAHRKRFSLWGTALFAVLFGPIALIWACLARANPGSDRELQKVARRASLENAVAAQRERTMPSVPAPAPEVAGEIAALADLRDRGLITEAEFSDRKRRLLSS